MQLIPGQNAPLDCHLLEVQMDYSAPLGDYVVDRSVFLLDAEGRVSGDQDFVFFNNRVSTGHAVVQSELTQAFSVDLHRIPAAVHKVVFVISLMDGLRKKQRMEGLADIRLSIYDLVQWREVVVFDMNPAGHRETALVLGELYRKNEGWKFRAMGSGFQGGLKPLAEMYGLTISEDEGIAEADPGTVESERSAAGILGTALASWINRVEFMKHGFSKPVYQKLKSINLLLDKLCVLVPQRQDLSALERDGLELEMTVTRYLPDFLEAYLEVPSPVRTLVIPDTAESAETIALDQLSIIEKNLRRILVTATQRKISRLSIERRFLRDKFDDCGLAL